MDITAADKARLLLNTPDLANRFVKINNREFAILHLSLKNLELFKAAVEPLESIYNLFVKSELSVADFMAFYKGDILKVLREDVPKTAAISLNLTVSEVKNLKSPLGLLTVAVNQWLHNMEIARIRIWFPHPKDDEKSNNSDPSDGNPEVIIERLQSAYHCSRQEALETTIPQVYLKGQSSAWAYKKTQESAKSNSESSSLNSEKIFYEGKYWNSFEEMGPEKYRAYVNERFSAK